MNHLMRGPLHLFAEVILENFEATTIRTVLSIATGASAAYKDKDSVRLEAAKQGQKGVKRWHN